MRVSVISALVLLLGLGCSSAAPSALDAGPPLGSGGSAASDDRLPLRIEFEAVPELAARQQVTLNVRATPPRVYQVRFALPTTGGDPLDATLDRSEASTDEFGLTSVVLTAPSAPTSFEVRASVGERLGTASLTVEQKGVATLQVEPRYLNKAVLRDITTWLATAYPDLSCADLPGIPPEDGPLKAPPAAKNEAPVIPQVPASTRLAVTLRSGHFVGGCTSVEMLPPGPPDKPQIVEVALLNRPIALSASSLVLSFDLETPEEAWSASLAEATPRVLAGVLGTSADDVDALLDTMRETSADSRQAFENVRQAEQWDTLLRSRWGQSAGTKLRDLVGAWLTAGRLRFESQPQAFAGLLTPIAQPDGVDVRSTADFDLQTVAGLDATRAGFVNRATLSWSASADDNVVLGTELYFVRSRLAEALAEAAALEASSLESAAEALGQTLDCAGLAGALVAAGSDAAVAHPGCDAACLTSACQTALGVLWQRGGDAEGLTISRLSLNATGKAYVGDGAEVAGITGAWIGNLTSEGTTRSTGGALTAATPPVTK